jgi:hypothetical protein
MDFPDFNFLTHQPKSPSYCVTDFACLRIVKFDASAGLRSSMSQVCLFVPLERRSRFYIFNNFGIMFLITSMTFLIWVVDVDDAGDRLALDMTLLLTIVAFKLVQAGLIPAVSYLTLLDKYTVMNFVVLLAASVCHFVAFYKPDTDGILWAICGGFWIIMNCVFVLQCSNLSKVNLGTIVLLLHSFPGVRVLLHFFMCACISHFFCPLSTPQVENVVSIYKIHQQH